MWVKQCHKPPIYGELWWSGGWFIIVLPTWVGIIESSKLLFSFRPNHHNVSMFRSHDMFGASMCISILSAGLILGRGSGPWEVGHDPRWLAAESAQCFGVSQFQMICGNNLVNPGGFPPFFDCQTSVSIPSAHESLVELSIPYWRTWRTGALAGSLPCNSST